MQQTQQPPKTWTDHPNPDNYSLPKSQKKIQVFHMSCCKSGVEVIW